MLIALEAGAFDGDARHHDELGGRNAAERTQAIAAAKLPIRGPPLGQAHWRIARISDAWRHRQ